MHQISRQVCFNWRRVDDQEIVESHLDMLDTKAIVWIDKMIQGDYFEGELNTSIDGIDYRGYWLISNKQ